MTAPDFQGLRQNPRPILGASIKVVAPTGHYDPDRLINVGANRWAVKAELGQIIPLKPKLMLEFELGAWINFTMGPHAEYIASISAAYFSTICFRRSLRVGVISPPACVNGSGKSVNRWTCSKRARFCDCNSMRFR